MGSLVNKAATDHAIQQKSESGLGLNVGGKGQGYTVAIEDYYSNTKHHGRKGT